MVYREFLFIILGRFLKQQLVDRENQVSSALEEILEERRVCILTDQVFAVIENIQCIEFENPVSRNIFSIEEARRSQLFVFSLSESTFDQIINLFGKWILRNRTIGYQLDIAMHKGQIGFVVDGCDR